MKLFLSIAFLVGVADYRIISFGRTFLYASVRAKNARDSKAHFSHSSWFRRLVCGRKNRRCCRVMSVPQIPDYAAALTDEETTARPAPLPGTRPEPDLQCRRPAIMPRDLEDLDLFREAGARLAVVCDAVAPLPLFSCLLLSGSPLPLATATLGSPRRIKSYLMSQDVVIIPKAS